MKSNKSRKKVTGMRVVRVTKTEFELDSGKFYGKRSADRRKKKNENI